MLHQQTFAISAGRTRFQVIYRFLYIIALKRNKWMALDRGSYNVMLCNRAKNPGTMHNRSSLSENLRLYSWFYKNLRQFLDFYENVVIHLASTKIYDKFLDFYENLRLYYCFYETLRQTSGRNWLTSCVQLKYFSAESPPSSLFRMLYTKYFVTSPSDRPWEHVST